MFRQCPHFMGFLPDSNGEIEVAVVSSTWMNGNEMEIAWPPCKTDRNLNEALTLHHLPADDWQWYGCRRILYATASLEQARKKAKLAEDTSGLEIGDEMEEKERRRKHAKNSEVAEMKQDLHRQVPSVGESSEYAFFISLSPWSPILSHKTLFIPFMLSTFPFQFLVELEPNQHISTHMETRLKKNSYQSLH
ncbi:unnamed protein product [Darwinula stevensoni]|uniref:Uncharacterized protein n=1 Tax=Darwinula stevensoni TaxID=69355 RepID=A0A7R8X198_9CRUS|nr:unnamed protein product [Darwinula stevensoni]CAG0882566.1 unnamed protein product [Darwinula stevensoni]